MILKTIFKGVFIRKKNTDFENLKQNIFKDIDHASNRDINEIYSLLSKALDKFDRDSKLKDLF
jgi:hypothetical protein